MEMCFPWVLHAPPILFLQILFTDLHATGPCSELKTLLFNQLPKLENYTVTECWCYSNGLQEIEIKLPPVFPKHVENTVEHHNVSRSSVFKLQQLQVLVRTGEGFIERYQDRTYSV
jgi:hypothetical protein